MLISTESTSGGDITADQEHLWPTLTNLDPSEQLRLLHARIAHLKRQQTGMKQYKEEMKQYKEEMKDMKQYKEKLENMKQFKEEMKTRKNWSTKSKKE
uniref:SARAH domain-containing protein n=1 Tax=Globodera pallida TaxID=36090 RepID=A0A183CHK0_GLOPA